MGKLVIIKNIGYQEYKDALEKGIAIDEISKVLSDTEEPPLEQATPIGMIFYICSLLAMTSFIICVIFFFFSVYLFNDTNTRRELNQTVEEVVEK